MTKEELDTLVDDNGGVAKAIIGYGINPIYLPDDAPVTVVCAWIRLYNQGRKDVDLIASWFGAPPTTVETKAD